MFDNILNILLPDYPMHPVFESADWFQPQHLPGLVLALCTIGFNPYVGQAGVGTINQVQVSNHSLVPSYSVIAQPQVLFLVLDQHLNRPSFQIVGYNGSHRSRQIISNNCNLLTFSPASGEDYLDYTQLVQSSNSFSQPVSAGFTQAGNTAPEAAVSQNIPAVFAELVFDRTDRKPSIRLAYADKRPISLFAGIDYFRAQIEGIEQDRHPETFWQRCISDCLGCQLGKLAEWDFEFGTVLFLDIQPRPPDDGDAAIIQTNLQDGMARRIFACGVVKQFADGIHFLGSLKALGFIDNEQQMPVLGGEQTPQRIQGDMLDYLGTAPGASPEELTVIGAMSAVTQRLYEPVYRGAVADADGQYYRPEITVDVFGNLLFDGLEKTLQFSGNPADGNHIASLLVSSCYYDTYRHRRLFLFSACYHQNSPNRSV